MATVASATSLVAMVYTPTWALDPIAPNSRVSAQTSPAAAAAPAQLTVEKVMSSPRRYVGSSAVDPTSRDSTTVLSTAVDAVLSTSAISAPDSPAPTANPNPVRPSRITGSVSL